MACPQLPTFTTIPGISNLVLKGKAGADFVGGLVELLGVERGTETELDAVTEEDVVGNGGDTAVVDLGLFSKSVLSHKQANPQETNLDEGNGVNAVLGGNLKTNGVASLGVPGGLGTSLDKLVDLVVVAGGENAQVVGGGDSGVVGRGVVTDGQGVVGDLSLLDIKSSGTTGEETLVADKGIDAGGGALEEVDESAAVEVGLLELQVGLDTLGLGGGEEGEDTLGLETLGEGVGKLNLGLESVGGVPGLGDGHACTVPGR